MQPTNELKWVKSQEAERDVLLNYTRQLDLEKYSANLAYWGVLNWNI